MKCPMTMNTFGIYGEKVFDQPQDCLKEECAWWDGTNGGCAILQLSKSIYYAGLYLPLIKDRMPSRERLV